MATDRALSILNLLSLITIIIIIINCGRATSLDDRWQNAHATFYGDDSAQETYGGACGYGYDNQVQQLFGTNTAALSETFFQNGYSCGQCFEIKCVNSPWCNPKGPGSIKITATNLCPHSDKPSNAGGWCNPPLMHFDMSLPAWKKIGIYQGGIIPVQYRRIACEYETGVKFTLVDTGTSDFNLVLITNVGGAGSIESVFIKGGTTGWIEMKRNWGENWATAQGGKFPNGPLSFRITLTDGEEAKDFMEVIPGGWQSKIGNIFTANTQF